MLPLSLSAPSPIECDDCIISFVLDLDICELRREGGGGRHGGGRREAERKGRAAEAHRCTQFDGHTHARVSTALYCIRVVFHPLPHSCCFLSLRVSERVWDEDSEKRVSDAQVRSGCDCWAAGAVAHAQTVRQQQRARHSAGAVQQRCDEKHKDEQRTVGSTTLLRSPLMTAARRTTRTATAAAAWCADRRALRGQGAPTQCAQNRCDKCTTTNKCKDACDSSHPTFAQMAGAQ